MLTSMLANMNLEPESYSQLEENDSSFSNSDVTITYSNGPTSGQSVTGLYTVSFSLGGTTTNIPYPQLKTRYISSVDMVPICCRVAKGSRILNSVNLNIPGQKMTALVGHSGAGKSTICLLYTSPSPRD